MQERVLPFALAVVITRHRRGISTAPAICLSQRLVPAEVELTVLRAGGATATPDG